MKNKYCKFSELRNESDVEQFFIMKLINDLGFKNEDVYTKPVIQREAYGKGSKKTCYVPDYILNDGKLPLVVIEAKAPDVDIKDYLHEAQEYASFINRKYTGANPIKYCITTNGVTTILNKPDENEPILELQFSDFELENQKFKLFKKYVSYNQLKKNSIQEKKFEFKRPEIDELRAILYTAHNKIRSSEKIGPKKAFYEFTKLLFIKMNEDKKLEEKIKEHGSIKAEDVLFSTQYIEFNTSRGMDPINQLFTKYKEELKEQVNSGKKKRIFKDEEVIDLKPATIKKVVELVQHYNLKSVEDDINGKVFETFLESSVRGKELGQFFTPRSVVKFMVKMANLKFFKNQCDEISPPKILDGSCGTGGFLIFALSDLFDKIPKNLTDTQVEHLKEKIKTKSIYGIDASKDDIVPITRMNMYLHGDGGSHIFLADTLDKDLLIDKDVRNEEKKELQELKELFSTTQFDIILTNPPFSMTYNSNNDEENRILQQYEISRLKNKSVASLKSNIMFLERYYDILKPGGKLLTVIDESVLNTEGSGKYMVLFRKWLMDHFIIRAIISLPKNTFVNQDAGVKTSILYLTKKYDLNESQLKTFMAISEDVGHNDAGKKTSEMGDLDKILLEFKKFEEGN